MSREPVAKPPWREVARSERRENPTAQHGKVGHHWILTLSCGHVAVWSERRLKLVPRKMRCKLCQGLR
jgi:hypothetical protein